MVSLETMDALALAVARRDKDAALALADLVQQEWTGEGVRLPPVRHLKVDVGRLRVMVFYDWAVVSHMGEQARRELTQRSDANIRSWLAGGPPLHLFGVERVELYELLLEQPHIFTETEILPLHQTELQNYQTALRRWLSLAGIQDTALAVNAIPDENPPPGNAHLDETP